MGHTTNCTVFYDSAPDLLLRYRALEVPGTAALNKGDYAQISSVSCRSAGHCSALGSYTDRSKRNQLFVVSKA